MSRELIVKTAAAAGAIHGTLVIYAAEGEAPAGAAAAIWAATGLDWARLAAAGVSRASRARCSISWRRRASTPSGCWCSAAASRRRKRRHADHRLDRSRRLARRQAARLRAEDGGRGPRRRRTRPQNGIGELAAGLRLRHYRFDKYKSRKKDDDAPNRSAHRDAPRRRPGRSRSRHRRSRRRRSTARILARDLINEPANVLGTVEFAERAAELDRARRRHRNPRRSAACASSA